VYRLSDELWELSETENDGTQTEQRVQSELNTKHELLVGVLYVDK